MTMFIANYPTTADHPSAVEHATDVNNPTIADVYARCETLPTARHH